MSKLQEFILSLEETIEGTAEEFDFLALKRERVKTVVEMLKLAKHNIEVMAEHNSYWHHLLTELNRLAAGVMDEGT